MGVKGSMKRSYPLYLFASPPATLPHPSIASHASSTCATKRRFSFGGSLLPLALPRAKRFGTHRSWARTPASFPQACASPQNESNESNEAESDTAAPTIRDLPLIALPMTAGNDFLFPGCQQVLTLDEAMAQRVLTDMTESEPPEFAYITLSAWGDPGSVGTIAVIEDFKYSPSEQSVLVCSGVARFRILQLNDDMTHAQIQVFHDEAPSEGQLEHITELEQKLVVAMKDIVTLSMKISDDKDQTHQRALEETLKRVEAFCADENGPEVNHWILSLTPNLRRELLSFIILNMLSVSFMDRREILESTDSAERLDAGLQGLEPFLRELAAKGAIVGALGREDSDEESPPSPHPSS